MKYEHIKFDVNNKIAVLTLNRPEKLNAWTETMEKEVHHAMTRANDDISISVIILTGEGKGFCAGADMGNLENLTGESIASDRGLAAIQLKDNAIGDKSYLPSDYGMRYTYFPTISKTIIAAINGPVAGLGLIMTLYCDLRFASSRAVFSTAFARRGLIAEHGISWILPKLVGHANALDLLLTARKFDAVEANEMGLVNKVFPEDDFLDNVVKYGEELATLSSPRSTKIIKRQVYTALLNNLEHSVLIGNSEMPQSFKSDDFKEGVAHFVEKRKPRFSGQ